MKSQNKMFRYGTLSEIRSYITLFIAIFIISHQVVFTHSLLQNQFFKKRLRKSTLKGHPDWERPFIKTSIANFQISQKRNISANIGDRISSVLGPSIVISCPFDGKPNPRVRWLFNNRLLDKRIRNNINIISKKGISKLIIRKFQYFQGGRYSCFVFNRHGNDKATTHLRPIVANQPTIYSERITKELTIFQNKVNITVGTDLIAYDQTDVIINCQHKPTSKNNVLRWSSTSISDKFKNAVKNRKQLVLKDITSEENGVYTCHVTGDNGLGDRQSSSINVISRSYPRILTRNDTIRQTRGRKLTVDIGDRVIVAEFSNLYIKCPHTAVPKAEITWMRNGMKIRGESENNDESTFTIRRIRMDQSDTYTCIVSNALGKVQATSKVTVVPEYSRPPRIKSTRSRAIVNLLSSDTSRVYKIGTPIRIVKGLPLRIRCETIGPPKPQITWEFNRKPLLKNDSAILRVGEELVFLGFEKKHSGDYKCVATNILGKARAFSDIRSIVPVPPKINGGKRYIKIASPSPLVIMKIGEELKTSGGRDIIIQCNTDGYPIPRLLWKHNSKIVKNSDKHEVNQARRHITIKNAQQWDSGIYSCFATNIAGATVETSKLQILAKGTPVITSKNAAIKVFDSRPLVDIQIGTNLTTLVAKTVRIFCPSDGSIDVTYEWTIDGKPLHDDARIAVNNGNELIIYDLQIFDSGVYTCRVLSNVGYDSMSSKIKIVGSANEVITDSGASSKEEVLSGPLGNDTEVAITLLTGRSHTLQCPVGRNIRAKIRWFKDGVPLLPSPSFSPQGDVLKMINVQVWFKGRYECQIVTKTKTRRVITNVDVIQFKKVEIKPKFNIIKAINPNQHLRAVIGNTIYAIDGVTVKILCPTIATPPANITWFFNNKALKGVKSYLQEKNTDGLIIPKMNPKFEGVYLCKAQQGDTVVTASSKLFYLESRAPGIVKSYKTLIIDPSSVLPIHTNIGEKITCNVDKRVYIHCPHTGVPPPKIFWKFNDSRLPDGIQDLKNGSIFISSIYHTHEGRYECFGVNPVGVASATSYVTVFGRYIPLLFKPEIKNLTLLSRPSKTMSVSIGTTISLPARSSILMNCPVSIYGRIRVKWEKNGELFTGSRFHSDGSVLMVKLDAKDSGEYICYSDGQKKFKFGSVKLNVLIPSADLIKDSDASGSLTALSPAYQGNITIGQNIRLLQGNEFTVSCPVSQSSTVKIKWLKNQEEIPFSDRQYVIRDTKLTVKDTKTPSEFNITCRVLGLLGSSDITTKVDVVAPKSVEIMKSEEDVFSVKSNTQVSTGSKVMILDGSSIDIECEAESIPPPTISWMFDGVKIQDGGNKYFKNNAKILSIPFASKKDNGVYRCSASNVLGSIAFSDTTLTTYVPRRPRIILSEETAKAGVLGVVEIIDSPTRKKRFAKKENVEVDMIEKEIGRNYQVIQGPEFKILCKSDGMPNPTIEWRKNKIVINIPPYQDYITLDTKNLQNGGEYQCTAENAFGKVSEISYIDLVAPAPPIIQHDSDYENESKILVHVDGVSKVEVFIGDNLRTLDGTVVFIRCPVIGMPRPSVTYLKDGVPVEFSSNIQVDTLGSLILQPASLKHKSDGVYTCRAKNQAGYQDMNTTITLYAPTTPQIVTVERKPVYTLNTTSDVGNLKLMIGQDGTAYKNTIIEIECPVVGFPFPLIMWEKDGQLLTNSARAYVKENATKLSYFVTEHKDTVFTCTATNTAGIAKAVSKISLKDPMPPRVLESRFKVITAKNFTTQGSIGENIQAIENSKVIIKCPHISEPVSKVIWSLAGSRNNFLETSEHVIISDDGFKLTITRLKEELTGVYSCEATNPFGSDKAKTIVSSFKIVVPSIQGATADIIAKPNIDSVNAIVGSDIYVKHGMRVVIDCPATGSPRPKISWLFNGETVEDRKNIFVGPSTSELTVEFAQTSDEGKYVCVAENFVERVRKSSYLLIGFEPEIQEVPAILSPLISTKVKELLEIPIGIKTSFVISGTTVNFQCIAKGYPLPLTKWYFNDYPIDYETNKKYKLILPNTLEVRKISAVDEGRYQCVVSNIFGTRQEESFLKVLVKPTIKAISKNVTYNKISEKVIKERIGGIITLIKGMSITISCPADGRPVPRVKWTKERKPMKLDSRIFLTLDNQLRINNVRLDDSGIYLCTASNKAGATRARFTLLVAEKPTAVIYAFVRNQNSVTSKALVLPSNKLIRPEGSRFQLYCYVNGVPRPKVTWLKNHDILPKVYSNRKFKDRIKVKNMSLEDTGMYVCLADNILGRATALLDVNIGVIPHIKSAKGEIQLTSTVERSVRIGISINAVKGASFKLICPVSGSPKPEVTWLRRINKDGSRITRMQSSEKNSLIIASFSRHLAGDYSCEAKNAVGIKETTSKVSFIEKAFISIQDDDPEERTDTNFIQVGKENIVHLIEGEKFRIVCFGDGDPLPTITFTRKLEPIPSHELLDLLGINGNGNKVINIINLTRGTNEEEIPLQKDFIEGHGYRKFKTQLKEIRYRHVRINSATMDHTGIYVCRVSNMLGSSSASVRVVVHPQPIPPFKGVWVTSTYSNCSTPCVRSNYGIQKRSLYCMAERRKEISDKNCNEKLKPQVEKQCRCNLCTTTWESGVWSACSHTCGSSGLKKRTPYCIYAGTKVKTQNTECNTNEKPKMSEICNRYPCSKENCVDKYRYCELIKKSNFCQMESYKTLCCESCVKNS